MTKDNTCKNNNGSYTKLNLIDYFQLFIIGLFFFIGMADFRFGVENYILSLLLIMWVSISFFFTPKLFKRTFIKGRYIFLGIFSVFYILPQLTLGIVISDILKGYLAIILVITPFVFADYYYNKFGGKIFIIISKILMSYYLYFSIRTIFLLMNNPKAARYLTYGSSATNFDEMNQFSGVGGGYDLAYGLVILIPVLLHFLVTSKQITRKEKVIYSISTILFTYTVVLSDFGMAFLLLTLGVFGLILTYIKGKNRLIFSGVFVVGISLFIISKGMIGDYLIDLSNSYLNNTISSRLNIVGHYLKGNIQLLDVSLRLAKNIQSIRTFLSYPFLGASVDALYDISILRSVYIGNHSDFFDTLAKYGILAGIPLITFYFLQVRSIYKRLKIFSGSIILSLTNTLFLLIAIFNYVSVISITVTMAWIIPGVIFMTRKNNIKLSKGN